MPFLRDHTNDSKYWTFFLRTTSSYTGGEIFPWEGAWGLFWGDTYTYCSITILFLLLQISQFWLLGIRWLRLLYIEVKGQALWFLVSVSFST